MNARVLPSADVDERATLGDGSTVWHLAQIRENARIGDESIIGRGAYVDAGVEVGPRSKIQNYALVYAPATLGAGVFIGPAAVLTNDVYPRSVSADGQLKGGDAWEAKGVRVGEGAAVGARAVVVAGVEIGPWSMVAAGAVVTRDVPAHALVMGMPARRTGWVGHAGVPLERTGEDRFRCPETGREYVHVDGHLKEAQ